MKKHKTILIFTLLLNMSVSLRAEVFYLVDGSSIVGEKIHSNDHDKILIKTKLLGDISIDADDVIRSSSHSPAKSSPLVNAHKHNHDTSSAPTSVSAHESASQNSTDTKSVGTGKVSNLAHSHIVTPQWSGEFAVDFEYASPVAPAAGVGRQIEHELTAMLVRKTPDFSYSLFGAYNYSEVKPVGKQADDWLLGADLRKDLNHDTFFYGQTNYIVDEVLGTKPQIETLAGVGFEVIKNKRSSLTLVPGIAYTDVNYTDPASTSRSISEFGYAGYIEYSFLLTEKTAFTTDILFVQSVEDLANYYFKGTIGLETQLFKNISLQTGYNFYYNDTLGDPFKKFTETLTTGITVKF